MDDIAYNEISSVSSFLTNLDSRLFQKTTALNELQVLDPREVVLIASLVPDSFFLRDQTEGVSLNGRKTGTDDPYAVEAFEIKLPLGFSSYPWIGDLQASYPSVFSGEKKIIKFIQNSRPTYAEDNPYYRKKSIHALQELAEDLQIRGISLADCLFIPYTEYRDGVQLGENFYHYLVGLIFRELGYLVCDEFVLSEYPGKAPRPDICAFKSPRISEMLRELLNKEVVSGGAFLQELQMLGVFQKQRMKPRKPIEVTEAESVIVEIERKSQQRKGLSQVLDYIASTMGLFEEGFVAGPFMEMLEGTITFDSQGEIRYSKGLRSIVPQVETPFASSLRDSRKREQLEQIERVMRFELAKIMPLEKTVRTCINRRGDVATYGDLESAISSLDIRDLA